MILAIALIFVGGILVYAGWKNLDVRALLLGNDQVAKKVTPPPAFSSSGR